MISDKSVKFEGLTQSLRIEPVLLIALRTSAFRAALKLHQQSIYFTTQLLWTLVVLSLMDAHTGLHAPHAICTTCIHTLNVYKQILFILSTCMSNE